MPNTRTYIIATINILVTVFIMMISNQGFELQHCTLWTKYVLSSVSQSVVICQCLMLSEPQECTPPMQGVDASCLYQQPHPTNEPLFHNILQLRKKKPYIYVVRVTQSHQTRHRVSYVTSCGSFSPHSTHHQLVKRLFPFCKLLSTWMTFVQLGCQKTCVRMCPWTNCLSELTKQFT